MIINEMDIQNLSVALVHYVYRNTIIEDYHSKLVHMDENLYKIMHRVVSKNLNFVKQFYSLLKETKKEELITISRTTMPPYKGKEFALFAYSFFLFTPLFCYLHNKKLLSKEKYKLNDNTITKLTRNLKLKKILYVIGILIWLIGITIGLIIEWLPSQYLNKGKYHYLEKKSKQ